MSVAENRLSAWARTMAGERAGDVVVAHRSGSAPRVDGRVLDRSAREEAEERLLAPGATRARGAGARGVPEPPDPERTCFERDRDRILHATAFRRLAGKTQVFIFPADHMRTRLTHALEVAQVATAVARACGLNVALTEAIALAHDCGHGPGGHASEDAFGAFLPDGYDHAVWGADVVLAPLNLCRETLDGVRNHSWSRPAPATPEGVVVSWADRCAYSAHDLEDAISAGVVDQADLPADVAAVLGTTRPRQLGILVEELIGCVRETGVVGMRPAVADALAVLRAFNYERIYTREASQHQAAAVVAVLRALTEFFAEQPARMPDAPAVEPGSPDAVRAAVAYVAGMTDRYACDTAVALLGWDERRLPAGIDLVRR